MFKRVFVFLVVVLLALGAMTGCSSGTPSSDTGSSSAPAESAESAAVASEDTGAAESSAPAASEDTGAASGAVDLVWVHMSPSAQSEQRAYAGFTAYLEEKGWSWNITEVNSDGSGDKMATNIEDAVAKGCDAIVVSMADLRASTAALQAANDANIPVFSIDSQYTPGVVCDITSNNYVMSSKVSSYLVDRLGGVGNVCALTMAEHHGVRKRGEVLTDVILAENP
ncbi:MAG: substrate-binding domain-containing protein, partial [Bacillota bacterium]